MRRAVLLVCLMAAPAWGQMPNRLTPQEAREGWVLLFDGETTFGWTTTAGVKVDDGRMILTREGKATLNIPLPPACELLFEMRNGVFLERGNEGGSIGNTNPGRAQKDWTKVRMFRRIAPGKEEDLIEVDGKQQSKGSSRRDPAPDKVSHADRLSFRAFLTSDELPPEIRSVKLRFETKPIFNGKDLTGWKVFDGKKSKFEVIDGAINIQDGPGDLQTEGKYQDFVLQLECISNGKHLNSGVFFRCRPNEYQNGYEAQVRNQFTSEPTQDYAIEVYDPKTHMLVEKKKVKSTAFDFGTGAIYRRVPARKEVAKDGEWFTMTIAAHGNHFATWVNGVQQVDWYDNRPPSDNARTGFRREGGHISLQGHDPTTNLSFRNFRIVELPER